MTSTSTRSNNEGRREFLRETLRSDFVSVFWSAIQARKSLGKFTMQELADTLGRDKSVVSKWFSNEPSNWQLDTIADIADALDLEIVVKAKERSSDTIHTPFGIEKDPVTLDGRSRTITNERPTLLSHGCQPSALTA